MVADKVATVVARAVRRAVMENIGSDNHSSGEVLKVVEEALRDAPPHALDRVDNLYVDGILRACVPNYVEHPSATGKSRIHPTEKPVGLLRYLIALFSHPGDLVLDPFGGSGSTGVAAVELGRSVVLIEREEDFFAAASNRVLRSQERREGHDGEELDSPQLRLLD
jgi:DNA modification methylase